MRLKDLLMEYRVIMSQSLWRSCSVRFPSLSAFQHWKAERAAVIEKTVSHFYCRLCSKRRKTSFQWMVNVVVLVDADDG